MKEDDKLHKMAADIVAMEKSYDSSMRGVLLDEVVSKYASILGKDFVEAYEYIVENQKEEYETYGDIDTSVRKIDVIFPPYKYNDQERVVSGIFLNDIFCDKKFLIFKEIIKHKDELLGRLTETFYHARLVDKEYTKRVNFDKHAHYGDIRDDGYVVSYEIGMFNQPIKVVGEKGMAFYYKHFDALMFAIRQPFLEIKENKNNEL